MKKFFITIVITAQLLFIFFLVYQFETIDKHGQELILNAEIHQESSLDEIELKYEINSIALHDWYQTETPKYNEVIYVTLSQEEGHIYKVKNVTEKKPKKIAATDIILKAKYQYKNDKGLDELYYGFERLELNLLDKSFNQGDEVEVTLLVGKYGQFKLDHIEKINPS